VPATKHPPPLPLPVGLLRDCPFEPPPFFAWVNLKSPPDFLLADSTSKLNDLFSFLAVPGTGIA